VSTRKLPRLSGRTRLHLANAKAVATLIPYELGRPLLRALGVLRKKPRGAWVFGGHGGRLYADNAAMVHAAARAAGQSVVWVTGDDALAKQLADAGIEVLRRNSLRARIAIENAEVLVYSHGITDLDHASWWLRLPRGLKIHINHCITQLKGPRVGAPLAAGPKRSEPFDWILASSPRERTNLRVWYPGRDDAIALGGGAHLDAFFQARDRAPTRTIVYFPTFRETPAARRALDACIAELSASPTLHAWLEAEDYTLLVADHVNTRDRRTEARDEAAGHPRVRFVDAEHALASILDASLLISDYSGVIGDFLALDRPTVFFAFDKEDYLRERTLFVDYDAFTFGPAPTSVAALIDVLISGTWKDLTPFAERRRTWQREFFPSLRPDYAERSLHTIRTLLAGHGTRRQSDLESRPAASDASAPIDPAA
jgi:hypothetical protein